MRSLLRLLPSVVLCLLPVLLLVTGCDKASPVAPEGSTLVVSANPTELSSTTGTSTVTAVLRKSNGQPVTPGTEVRFSTTLGTIDPVAKTDSSGVATATLRGDGRLGTAKVTVSAGGIAAVDPIEVTIGTAAKTLTLQATPTTVAAGGGSVSLLALVRDARGLPLSGQGVNFTTELGTLASRGGIVQTNGNGQARDTLTLSKADLANNQSSVTVTAQTASGDGSLVSSTFNIQVQSDRPVAKFKWEKGSSDFEVIFTDQSQGTGSLVYTWDFGDGSAGSGKTVRHTYASGGQKVVQLTVRNPDSNLSDSVSATITVPVTGTGGSTP